MQVKFGDISLLISVNSDAAIPSVEETLSIQTSDSYSYSQISRVARR